MTRPRRIPHQSLAAKTEAPKSQSWIELRPDYWRGRAMVRLMCAKEADRIDDQTNHTRFAAEYEAIAAKLESPTA